MSASDKAWIQRELIETLLEPDWVRYFGVLQPELGMALLSCVDKIIPFMPFSRKEQVIMADTMLRNMLKRYVDPPVIGHNVEGYNRRLIGNIVVNFVERVADIVGLQYTETLGARAISRGVQDISKLVIKSYLKQEIQRLGEKVTLHSRELRKAWVITTHTDDVMVHASTCSHFELVFSEPPNQPSCIFTR